MATALYLQTILSDILYIPSYDTQRYFNFLYKHVILWLCLGPDIDRSAAVDSRCQYRQDE
jgi:hypothetical protein